MNSENSTPRKPLRLWPGAVAGGLLVIGYIVPAIVPEAAGLEILVLDQTRPDIGLPVVKVTVPGLRHFWPRFGPGRLYDVPVELGLIPQRLSEAQLNPVPPAA